ncbi:hypothetical protein SESBI_20076 [Sesbania bispinosa]|nr:hypothetical protein SESBI_20076 [Sesbania bispinosa]
MATHVYTNCIMKKKKCTTKYNVLATKNPYPTTTKKYTRHCIPSMENENSRNATRSITPATVIRANHIPFMSCCIILLSSDFLERLAVVRDTNEM